jgi:hypothetical protein
MKRRYSRYDLWPRDKDNSLVFGSTNEAFFYASQIFNKLAPVAEVRKQYEAINKEFKKQNEAKKRNLFYLFQVSFRRQFHRECLEEIDRLQDFMGG